MEPRPQSSRLTWLAVVFGASACALLGSVGADARWLAALGRVIAAHGSIPSGIPYAAAPSHDWVNVPVLGELAFHALQGLGGDRALVVAQVVAVALSFALLARSMQAIGAPDASRAIVLVMVLFAAAPVFVIVRAQLFSLVLFSALLLLLRCETMTPTRRIWLLVPLVALWANLHGAVLAGAPVAATYLLFERSRRQPLVSGGVLVGCAVALFLTPALWHSSAYYLGVLRSEAAVRGEGMWAPLSLHALFDVLFVVLAVPLLFFAWRSGLRLWELVCIGAYAAMTLHASRNGVWLLLLIAAPAARGLARERLQGFTVSRRTLALCGWVPAFLLVAGLVQEPRQGGAGERMRREAASLAAGKPILADGIDAEQLALDGQRVWIANPLDAFSRRDQRLYLEWLDAHPAGDALLRGPTSVVLVSRGSPPQQRLAHDPAFKPVGSDKKSVLYVRAPSNE